MPNSAPARGFTLIELMVVIMIAVVVAAAGVVALGQIRAADADTTANVLAGAMRYVATLAVHRNKTYRLVVDMDGRRWWVEAANDDDPCARFVPEDADPPADAVATGDDADLEDAKKAVDEAPSGASFAAEESDLLKGEFEPETGVSGVLTAHHQDPQNEGKTAIYFYPNGNVERAFVWVAQEVEDNGQLSLRPEITLRLENLGQVQRVSKVLEASDFNRTASEARL